MKNFRHYISVAALTAGLLASASATAALIQFTSRAAFDAATTGQIIEPNIAPENSYIPLGFVTYNGITYPGYAYMIDPGYEPDLYEYGTGPVLLLANDTSLSFSPVTAFAADFASLGDFGTDVTITINGETQVLTMSPRQELTFYGFISSSPFSSVSLSTDAELLILDNVTRANAIAAIPEPASFALFGLALAGLACTRRRR